MLKFGGKKELTRYPGHEFFKKRVKNSSIDKGEVRQLCAQIGMLFFEEATKGNWLDIGTQPIDDFYYRNLGFDMSSQKVIRFSKVLDLAVELFEGYKGPTLKGHEAIHIILLIDSLMDDYTRSWQPNFIRSFDEFRAKSASDKREKMGDFWFSYGSLTQTQSSNARTIQQRHKFFSEKIISKLNPIRKDDIRMYGQLEREIIYYRDNKKCAVCDSEIKWSDLQTHHVNEHQHGGQTTIENGVSVHIDCHPKGQAAIDFYNKWKAKKDAEITQQSL